MATTQTYTSYMTTDRPKQASVTVRFPAEVLEGMRKLAHADDRSLNSEIVRALREFIERRQREAEQHLAKMAS